MTCTTITCIDKSAKEKAPEFVPEENGPSALPSQELLAKLVRTPGIAPRKGVAKRAKAPTKRRLTSKKKVRFCRLYDKINFRHASCEDLAQSWNQPEDYRKFKSDVCNTVLQANAASTSDDAAAVAKKSGECIRGLEFLVTEETRNTRQRWIEDTVKGVLLRQGLQKLLGLSNPEQLCETAAAASKHSRACAMVLAAIDQKEAHS